MTPSFFSWHDDLKSNAVLGLLSKAGLLLEVKGELPDRLRPMAPLHQAGKEDLSFYHNAKYREDLDRTQAGAVLLPEGFEGSLRTAAIVVRDVHRALALAGGAFLIESPLEPGVHPTALVAKSAIIDPSASIGAYVVVEEGAVIGAHTRLDPHVWIGAKAALGASCHVESHVTISHAVIGDRVRIKPGARVGQRGFGWALSPEGHIPKPQTGCVRIGSDVEIGANTTIDRGSVEDTLIGEGTVIDNLCHIGHNCKIGRFCAIAGASAFAGTTELGDFVIIGGAVISKGHVRVGDGAMVHINSFIGSHVKPGEHVVGNPARPLQAYQRLLRSWSRIARGAKGS